MSSKELKGEAFNLAKAHYEEIQLVFDRLNELDTVTTRLRLREIFHSFHVQIHFVL